LYTSLFELANIRPNWNNNLEIGKAKEDMKIRKIVSMYGLHDHRADMDIVECK
jgi:hypothetical protein